MAAILVGRDVLIEIMRHGVCLSLVVILERLDVLGFYMVQVLEDMLECGSLFRGVLGARID